MTKHCHHLFSMSLLKRAGCIALLTKKRGAVICSEDCLRSRYFDHHVIILSERRYLRSTPQHTRRR